MAEPQVRPVPPRMSYFARTLGRPGWLDALDDDEAHYLAEVIAPALARHLHLRRLIDDADLDALEGEPHESD